MKLTITWLLIALCLLWTACGQVYGPVKESQSLMEAKDDIVSQWSKTIAAEPSESGLAKARTYFESKKAELNAKRDAVKNAPQGFNSDWHTNFLTHEGRTSKALDEIRVAIAVGGGYDLGQNFTKLRKEFEDSVQPY